MDKEAMNSITETQSEPVKTIYVNFLKKDFLEDY